MHRAKAAASHAVGAVARVRAEIATALAFLAGWALITHGVASVTRPIAWTFSAGLLCLSLGGWRLLLIVVVDGMYALTRKQDGDRG
jgi:hypothetical protein